MKTILDVLSGPMSEDGKWYHCPHCKANFNFMDVMDGDAAIPVDTHERIYSCAVCGKDFRMPE